MHSFAPYTQILTTIQLCKALSYRPLKGDFFSGTREEKAGQAVSTIGPAVFNGGMTTFLALVLLGASTSHVFVTFFKVFVLTVVFGLLHGLVLLPVLLSLFGPLPSLQTTISTNTLVSSDSPVESSRIINVQVSIYVKKPNGS